jgi:hypothetical protein
MVIMDAAANGRTIQGLFIDPSRTVQYTTVTGGNPAGSIFPAV